MTNPIAPDLQPHAIPIGELHPWDANPNVGDLDAIERSLAKFGQRELGLWRTEVIDGEQRKVVYSGNHRLIVARDRLGWTHFAASCADDMTPDEIRAYAVATNRTRDLADTDEQAMADLLATLEDQPDLLDATGFDGTAIDELLESIQAAEPDNRIDDNTEPEPPPEPPADPVTRRGDVWLLGHHRIMCGDCRDADDVTKLLDGTTINLAFTSPPYADRRKYDETSGFKPIPPDEYVEWFEPVQTNVVPHLADDGSWFVNVRAGSHDGERDLYVLNLVLAHCSEWGWRLVDDFVWNRPAIPGDPNSMRRFKNGYEPIYHFTKEKGFKFKPDDVRHASNRTITYSDVSSSGVDLNAERSQGVAGAMVVPSDLIVPGLAYPSNVLPSFSGTPEAHGHSAAFPVGLPDFFVRAYTDEGDAVFDPFMGSGSTLLAADQNGRVGFGMELSPGYVDVICRRYQTATGTVPVLESSGGSVSFV